MEYDLAEAIESCRKVVNVLLGERQSSLDILLDELDAMNAEEITVADCKNFI